MAVSFAAVAACATCAPLNPSYKAEEFDFYLSDLDAKALIVSSGDPSPAREVAGARNIPVIELTEAGEQDAGVLRLSGPDIASGVDGGFAEPDDIALVLHTSGTTSRPKIVPLTHVNVCTSGHNVASTLQLTANDRCLNVMPLFHIHGLIGAVMSSLTAGASIVCTPGFDPGRFFEWIDVFEPTWYTAVPTIHQAVLGRAQENTGIIARRPLRLIRSSSASLPTPVMEALESVFGTQVIESYGMTEAAHQMTSNPLAPRPRKPGSVGVAAGPDVAIMNEAGDLLPIGEVGEVVISGANVTPGYQRNPEANQKAFTEGWFRTGDLGRFDEERYLFLTGRLKEMINRGGENIAPREIDDVLAEHPAVAQAVTFAVPHPSLGEDVAAAIVLKEGVGATPSDIRGFAAEKLAEFKVPRQIIFLDEIPKGPTGKLQRIGLADKLADKLDAERAKNFVAAETPIESDISELWQQLLKVECVGVRDDFYALGGDSLLTTTMLLELERRFGASIPVETFLESPTIENLVRFLQDESQSPLQEAQSNESEPARGIKDGFSRVSGIAFSSAWRSMHRAINQRVSGFTE